jgi:hypothetical protein
VIPAAASHAPVDNAIAVEGAAPEVLLLDEPSSGIAKPETEALGALLRGIQQETRCAMIVIEHDLALVTQVSDELVALDAGHLISEGKPEEVLAHPGVISSYLGGSLELLGSSVSGSGELARPRGRRLLTALGDGWRRSRSQGPSPWPWSTAAAWLLTSRSATGGGGGCR